MAPSFLSRPWLSLSLGFMTVFIWAGSLLFQPCGLGPQNCTHSINMYQVDDKAVLFTRHLILNVPESPKENSIFSPSFFSFLLAAFPSSLYLPPFPSLAPPCPVFQKGAPIKSVSFSVHQKYHEQ